MSNNLVSPFVVTVSGDPVSGKSSSIKALINQYIDDGFSFVENTESDFSGFEKVIIKIGAGQLFREVANRAGRSLDELRTLAKDHYTVRSLIGTATNKDFFENLSDSDLDKSIDAFIDEYMVLAIHKMQEKCSHCKEAIIIADSRIVGLLMNQKHETCMNVRLSVQPEIAAERLVKDSKNRPGELKNIDTNSALESVKKREAEDRSRFIATYSDDIRDQKKNAKFDVKNMDNYNLVIDTSGASTSTVVKTMYSCIEKARYSQEFNKYWRSTKYIYPAFEKYFDEEIAPPPIEIIEVNGKCYAITGEKYIGIGNKNGYSHESNEKNESGYPLVPTVTLAKDDELLFTKGENGKVTGEPANRYVEKNVSQKYIRAWANSFGFNYPHLGNRNKGMTK